MTDNTTGKEEKKKVEGKMLHDTSNTSNKVNANLIFK